MTFKRYTKIFIFTAIIIFAAAFTIPFGTVGVAAAGWDGTASETLSGDGTEGNPYIVNSAADLAYLAAEVNGGNDFSGKTISVAADEIDLNNSQLSIGYANYNTETYDLKPFNGTFNGNNVVVKNLSLSVAEEEGIPSYYGLFGYIGQSGTVTGVNLDTATAVVTKNASPDVTEDYYFGGIAGINEGTISSCNVNNVTATNFYYVGGICGENSESSDSVCVTITGCSVASITATGCGRLAGVAVTNYGKIDGCTVGGKFSSDGGSFGGIVCDNGTEGEISYCRFSGTISGSLGGIGGIAYDNGGKITACYAKSDFAASGNVGGISVSNSGGITSCYFYGSINGENVGGITVYNNEGTITDCAAIGSGEFAATYYAGGIVANNYGTVKNVFVSGNVSSDQNMTIINAGTDNGYYDKAGYAGETSGNGFSVNDFSKVELGTGFEIESGYFPFIKEIKDYSTEFSEDMKKCFSVSDYVTVTVGDEPLYQRKGLKTDLPTPSKVGYTFNGWSDGTNLYNGKKEFTSDTVLTAVYKLNAIEYLSISDGKLKNYDGNPYVVTAEFNFPLTLSYEWYRSKSGEDGTFEKVDKFTGNEIEIKDVADSGLYYCRAYYVDGEDVTEATSAKVKVTVLKASYGEITYPYESGQTYLDGGEYSGKTLSEYSLASGFFWHDDKVAPTVNKTSYAAYYNADPDNYYNYGLTINLTLKKGNYSNIAYNYGENGYIYGGRYAKKTLDSIQLDDGFKWQDGSVVFDVGEKYYLAYYNADSTNYNDYSLELKVKTDKGVYSGITHPSLTVQYKETSTLSDHEDELNEGFYWCDGTVKPTVKVTEYSAYYNADPERYEDYDLKITIYVNCATPKVNPVIVIPENEPLYNDGNFPTITLSEGDTNGTISWDKATLDANVKEYYWTFVPDDENYSTVRKTASLTVYVKYVVAVEVTSLPKKTTYNALETFARDGMVITATFSGDRKEVVENFDVVYPTEKDKLVFGDESVAIKYTYDEISKTATVPVTVVKNVVESPVDKSEYRYDGNAKRSLMQNTALYTVESDEGTVPGSYAVKFILIDKNNYSFDDGSSEVTAKWTILPYLVTIPQISGSFVYSGQPQYSGISESSYYKILDGQARTDAGTYEITLRLVNSNLYNWSGLDGEKAVEDVKIKWTIGVKYVKDPEIVQKEYVYNDGSLIEFKYNIYDGTVADKSGATDAGMYTITFTLKNENYAWSYDTARPTRTLSFTIKPKPVAVPEVTETFVYSGAEYTLNLTDTYAYTVSDKIGRNAGTYYVKFSLTSGNYVWEDGTSEVKSIAWRIGQKSVDKPVKEEVVLTYNGEYINLPLKASDDCVISGDRQRDAGKYVAKAALKDKVNFIWSDDNTADDISIEWSINRKEIELPVLAGGYVYTGETLTASLNVSEVNVTGNTGINAGKYEMTVSLLDENNYVWKDGSSKTKTVQWQIAKMKIEKPQKIDDGTYNGQEQTARISGGKYLILGGNVAKNAGKYVVTAALKDKNNCEWTDGSVNDITLEWVINKAEIAVPKESSALIYSGAEQKADIMETSLYTLSGNFATAVGEYEATATLVDGNNYKFVGTDETAVKIKFHVYAVKLSVDGSETQIDYVPGTALPVPTKEGYNFAGWYLDSECKTERVETISDLTSDAVLYAKWVKDGTPDVSPDPGEKKSSGLSTKAIVGITIGGLCGLIAIALVIYVATRPRSNRFRD